MKQINITRRQLIGAGIAAGVVAAIPLTGLWVSIPEEDILPIGPNADDNTPYKADQVGELDNEVTKQLSLYCQWCMKAWEFTHTEQYITSLPDLLTLKCSQAPSYLSEYTNAAELIGRTSERLQSPEEAFSYLMFTAREQELSRQTRLGRASYFVFDELLRHMLATGGFKRFGLQNYNGYIHLPFYDNNAYRREATL